MWIAFILYIYMHSFFLKLRDAILALGIKSNYSKLLLIRMSVEGSFVILCYPQSLFVIIVLHPLYYCFTNKWIAVYFAEC